MKIGKCLNCFKGFKYKPASHTGKYCSSACQCAHFKQLRIEEWLAGGRKPGKATLKEYLVSVNGRKCSLCGLSEWNNLPIPLDIDHENGNPYDDSPKNLRFLCPNCHAQTDSYKGRNKGKGRVHRRERAKLDYKRQAPVAQFGTAPDL